MIVIPKIKHLEINIIDNKFIYKLYDKREDFNFSNVRMPYKCSNIPESIFYSALVGEFLRIARSSSLFTDFSLSLGLLVLFQLFSFLPASLQLGDGDLPCLIVQRTFPAA